MFIYSKKLYYAQFGSLHLVRTAYDEKHDFVNAFNCPYLPGNRNMNFYRCALIDKDTPYEFLYTAFIEAEEYKECGDDISPVHVNGYFIGANHGNPNTIDVYTDEHGLTEAAIGEVVCDGKYTFTIVQVQDSSRLLLSYINENGQTEVVPVGDTLYFPDPSDEKLKNMRVHVKGSCQHMNLRPCGNKRSSVILGDGKPAEGNRFYDEITVFDEYNILDFKDIVEYLHINAGRNKNASYFENDIDTPLAKMFLKHVFKEKGRVETLHEVELIKNAHLDYWFGAQQINFSHDETAWFNAPHSSFEEGFHKALMGTEIKSTDGTVPYKFYLADAAKKKGYYLFIDPDYGVGKDESRNVLSKAAKISEWRTKLYCYVAGERDVEPGFKMSLKYDKGPFDPADIS